MSQSVSCPTGVASWPDVATWLAEHGSPAQMRMIDGQLAFPDEEPLADWRELRVAIGGAMVTIRRGENSVELVTWGNADDATQSAADALAKAFARQNRPTG